MQRAERVYALNKFSQGATHCSVVAAAEEAGCAVCQLCGVVCGDLRQLCEVHAATAAHCARAALLGYGSAGAEATGGELIISRSDLPSASKPSLAQRFSQPLHL